MIGLFDGIKIGTGAVFGAIAVAPIAYWLGVSDGKQSERQAALSRSVEIIRERGVINGETFKMDDYDLCVALSGGLSDTTDCEHLRRMGVNSSTKADRRAIDSQ